MGISHQEENQNQNNGSHQVIFDWDSEEQLDRVTDLSPLMSSCVKATEQILHTKPDLLPNLIRNEAALCRCEFGG